MYLYGAFDTFKGKNGSSGDIYTEQGSDIVQLGKGKASIHIDMPATARLLPAQAMTSSSSTTASVAAMS